MNTVYIKTYGCQMNERDTEAVAESLRKQGWKIVDKEEEAKVVLLNTCSVRQAAERKALGKAKELAKRKQTDSRFTFGLIGCMAQRKGKALLRQLPDLDLLVGTQQLHRVSGALKAIETAEKAGLERPATSIELDWDKQAQNKQDWSKGGKTHFGLCQHHARLQHELRLLRGT